MLFIRGLDYSTPALWPHFLPYKPVHMSPLIEASHSARSHLTLNSHTKCLFSSYEKQASPLSEISLDTAEISVSGLKSVESYSKGVS